LGHEAADVLKLRDNIQNEIIWNICYAYRVTEVTSASHVELFSVDDVAETGVSNVEAKLRREDDEWCFTLTPVWLARF
jgi:hypothetical protein